MGSHLGRLLKKAHLRRYPAASPSWRRGKKSLLIRRDATPRLSSVGRILVVNGFKPFTPQDFACLREAASA